MPNLSVNLKSSNDEITASGNFRVVDMWYLLKIKITNDNSRQPVKVRGEKYTIITKTKYLHRRYFSLALTSSQPPYPSKWSERRPPPSCPRAHPRDPKAPPIRCHSLGNFRPIDASYHNQERERKEEQVNAPHVVDGICDRHCLTAYRLWYFHLTTTPQSTHKTNWI